MKPDAWMTDDFRIVSNESRERMFKGLQEVYSEPLFTLDTVRKWLEEPPSEAMIDEAMTYLSQCNSPQESARLFYIAMVGVKLLEIEDEPINAAQQRYETANPLGGPARLFEAIAERTRAGEDYHYVLADYGVTVEVK